MAAAGYESEDWRADSTGSRGVRVSGLRGPVLSAWVAEGRNRILGQEWTESEERTFSDLVYKATLAGFVASATGRSAQGFGGHALSADLEGG